MSKSSGTPWIHAIASSFGDGGSLQPFRLLRQDAGNLRKRYVSDWQTFNQLIFASAVYVFFTNLLPGITFASDLYNLTGRNWGTIEVVFSTGICGIVFSLYVQTFTGFDICYIIATCTMEFQISVLSLSMIARN